LIQRKYTDKKKYYEELAERDENEGENFVHTSEKDSTRPQFRTSKGRIVYGGGGITPDYIVKSDKLTELSASLLRKNIFYIYTLKYLDGHSKVIQSEFGNDLAKFRNEFVLNESDLQDFLTFAKEKEIKIDEKDLAKDKDYILSRLKAQIARNFWKNEGWFSVLLQGDTQYLKAMTLFDKAKQLVTVK
jgi:carboxyl-terminal processing protease